MVRRYVTGKRVQRALQDTMVLFKLLGPQETISVQTISGKEEMTQKNKLTDAARVCGA